MLLLSENNKSSVSIANTNKSKRSKVFDFTVKGDLSQVNINNTWLAIENFFGQCLPRHLKMGAVSMFKLLDTSDIHNTIHERRPFLNVLKAAVFFDNGQYRIISSFFIDPSECEGHFSQRSMVPLLLFSKCMAITGEILVAFLNGGHNTVPLASKTGEIKATTDSIIAPPVLVFSEAILLKKMRAFSATKNTAWADGKMVGGIEKIFYKMIPASVFFDAVSEIFT